MEVNLAGATLPMQQLLIKTGTPVFMQPFYLTAQDGSRVIKSPVIRIPPTRFNPGLMNLLRGNYRQALIQGKVLLRTGMLHGLPTTCASLLILIQMWWTIIPASIYPIHFSGIQKRCLIMWKPLLNWDRKMLRKHG